jgi:N-acetylgalactosamine-N,N'-diacetylbacillosaminyl-diphospho-undecaprenol 4-alpha-N-acetylgalactosaminyltransferase
MKKVLFIYDAMHTLGGVQRTISILSGDLARRGYATTLLSRSKSESFVYAFHGRVVHAKRTSLDAATGDLIYRRKVLRSLNDHDVVIDYRAKADDDPLSVLAKSRRLDGRMILAIRNATIETYLGRDPVKARSMFGGCRRILCLTKEMQRDVADRYGLTNITVIPNAIDTHEIDRLLAAEPPHDLPDRYVLASGRLVHQKGFDILLHALRGSTLERDGIKLVILGDGRDKDDLVALAQRLGLADKIVFRGFVANPFIYKKRAEFFVFPSRYEGFGNALLESLYCELPVVAFNCITGPGDFVIHETNGLLVEPFDRRQLMGSGRDDVRDEDVMNLRQTIDRMHMDADLRLSLRRQSRSSVEQFRIEHIAEMYEQIFKDRA